MTIWTVCFLQLEVPRLSFTIESTQIILWLCTACFLCTVILTLLPTNQHIEIYGSHVFFHHSVLCFWLIFFNKTSQHVMLDVFVLCWKYRFYIFGLESYLEKHFGTLVIVIIDESTSSNSTADLYQYQSTFHPAIFPLRSGVQFSYSLILLQHLM